MTDMTPPPRVDPNDPDLLPIAAIADRYVWARGTHPVTIYRWAVGGRVASDGARVRLPVVRTPRGMHTSDAAVRWWVGRLSGEAVEYIAPTDAGRESDLDRIEAELAAAGLR